MSRLLPQEILAAPFGELAEGIHHKSASRQYSYVTQSRALALMWWPTSENEMLRRVLDLARLAELPDSASSVIVDGTSNLFAMAYFLRFQASAEDIETFIEGSPGLQGITPEQFSPAHKYLPYSDDRGPDSRHVYFHVDSRYPWFNPVIETRGRRYEVPWDSHSRGGTVIIDDETHTVFVVAHRS